MLLNKILINHHTQYVVNILFRIQNSEIFQKISQTTNIHVCTALVNIRNIYVKYSHCGPIHVNAIGLWVPLSANFIIICQLS